MAKIFTDAEIVQLAKSAMRDAPDHAITEADWEIIVAWAGRARVQELMLDRALRGDLALSVVNGRVIVALPRESRRIGAK